MTEANQPGKISSLPKSPSSRAEEEEKAQKRKQNYHVRLLPTLIKLCANTFPALGHSEKESIFIDEARFSISPIIKEVLEMSSTS